MSRHLSSYTVVWNAVKFKQQVADELIFWSVSNPVIKFYMCMVYNMSTYCVRIWNGSVKAFDYVIHETLLAELWFYGIQERMKSGSDPV